MGIERTLSIIKPDATERNITGVINRVIEDAGLRIIGQKRVHWTFEQAQEFYDQHLGAPFYPDLCKFMSSGPIVVQVLESDDAIAKYRRIMGATNPVDADPGTLRRRFAISMQQNSVHGSDSPASADREIALNFAPDEIVG